MVGQDSAVHNSLMTEKCRSTLWKIAYYRYQFDSKSKDPIKIVPIS